MSEDWLPEHAPRHEQHGIAWTAEHVRRLRLDDSNTLPPIDAARVPPTLPGYYVWDTWPVCDVRGAAAVIDGWRVLVALTAPTALPPEERHHVARHRLVVSHHGGPWRDGGPLFPAGTALGSRQWAGSALYDSASNAASFFYTGTGREDETERSYEQRIALVTARPVADDRTIAFTDWTPHHVILEPDGRIYKPTRGTGGGPGRIDAFRDPAIFQDPASAQWYVLFTASLVGSACACDGAIGIAQANNAAFTNWTLLPPLLHANCVNKELERPHLIVRDGRYYVFFSTHTSTFQPPLSGPEGLYGFVASDLHGVYRPLNGSGLVLANPASEPFQAYSWLVLPDGWVIGFLNYFNLGGKADVEAWSPEAQARHFGGRLSPMVRFDIDGDRTRIVAVRYDPLSVF